MTDNVHILDMITRLDIPVERVLNRALEGDLDSAIVVGWTKAGEFYFASSMADGADVIYLFEMAKKLLLEVGSQG